MEVLITMMPMVIRLGKADPDCSEGIMIMMPKAIRSEKADLVFSEE